MDDQSMSQPVMPAQPMGPTETKSPAILWYVVLAAIVLGLGALYYYTQSPSTDTGSEATALSGGDTTTDASTDLTQLEGVSAELGTDAAAVDTAIQGL